MSLASDWAATKQRQQSDWQFELYFLITGIIFVDFYFLKKLSTAFRATW
jgi:hypothetical protein